jgi:quercetin dioxygenase-like cupin family protein
MAGFGVSRSSEQEWKPTQTRVEQGRTIVDLTTELGLQQSRARLWRYPPGASGTRHIEHAQEEVFVVLAGTLTLLLGEAGERHDLAAGSVAGIAPGTVLQVRNEGDEELKLFVYGAPPVTGKAEVLTEPEPAS